jgi:hypothetical protein
MLGLLMTQLIGEQVMTEVRFDRAAYNRERDLDWVASRFLGGVEAAETLRTGTLQARAQAIQGLENLASAWSRMSHARSWAYDYPKHVHLCRIIERERALLAAESVRVARSRHRAAVREVSNRLHRCGSASIAMLKRLGRARGGLLAALASRGFRDDVR